MAVWNAKTGNRKLVFHDLGGTEALAVASWQAAWRVAAVGPSGIVILQPRDSGVEYFNIKITRRSLTTLSFSADATMLVATGYDYCSVWDVESGKLRMEVELGDTFGDYDATFTSDGKEVLLVGNSDDVIRYFDAATGTELRQVRWLERFRQLSVSADHKRMASCGHRTGGVVVWDVDSGQMLTTLGAPNAYSHVAIAADGNTAAGARVDRTGIDGIDAWEIQGSRSP